MTISLQDGQLMVGGVSTHYVRAGRGPVVLVIHGGAPGVCALVNWCPSIHPLADAGFGVIAFD